MLQSYNALLKKRNQFLKMVVSTGKCNDFYLDILNDKFSTLAVEITNYLPQISDKITNYLLQVADLLLKSKNQVLVKSKNQVMEFKKDYL